MAVVVRVYPKFCITLSLHSVARAAFQKIHTLALRVLMCTRNGTGSAIGMAEVAVRTLRILLVAACLIS